MLAVVVSDVEVDRSNQVRAQRVGSNPNNFVRCRMLLEQEAQEVVRNLPPSTGNPLSETLERVLENRYVRNAQGEG